MNDEAGPSGTQRTYLENDTTERDRLLEDNTEITEGDEPSTHELEIRKKRGKMKRLECVHLLLCDLDLVIIAQIAILYCLDCSLFRLVCRAAVQFTALTPRPENAPKLATPTPYLGLIFGTNILILILHIFLPRPEVGEITRGYLHGGALIDFIGTEGPVSKFHLVVLDLSILALQCVMLSAHMKKKRLKQALGIRQQSGPDNDPSGTSGSQVAGSNEDVDLSNEQDHDAEERGVHRANSPDREADVEASDTTDDTSVPAHSDLDALHSGQVVIADLYILTTIREQFVVFRNARRAASSNTADGATTSSMTARLISAGRRVGLQATLQPRAAG